MCGHKGCDISLSQIMQVIDDGERRLVLCPNHMIMYLLGTVKPEDIVLEKSQLSEELKCVIDGKPAMLFKDGPTEYHLCMEHIAKLIAHNLAPQEWKALVNIYGPDEFLLHDDFYDEEGTALQPVVARINN